MEDDEILQARIQEFIEQLSPDSSSKCSSLERIRKPALMPTSRTTTSVLNQCGVRLVDEQNGDHWYRCLIGECLEKKTMIKLSKTSTHSGSSHLRDAHGIISSKMKMRNHYKACSECNSLTKAEPCPMQISLNSPRLEHGTNGHGNVESMVHDIYPLARNIFEESHMPESTNENGMAKRARIVDEFVENDSVGIRRSMISEEERLATMTAAISTLLTCIGENPEREGLVRTPSRMAKALLDCTKGYDMKVDEVINGAIFEEYHHEMILVKDIDIYSLCEHHMVPFVGKVHIAYIPRSKVLGLSKLARIADMYAQRLQVQERLTKEIAEAIYHSVNPLGVGVVIEASHMCMVMRGVQKSGSTTITSSVLGCFQSDPRTRAEFMSLIRLPK